MGLLVDFSLERGKGGCLTAFVLDGLLQRRPEIFDQPKGSDARGVGMGNELDLLLQSRVLFTTWVLARSICPLSHLSLILSALTAFVLDGLLQRLSLIHI